MPTKLNNQFREIEIRIICELAWKKGSSVIKILEYMRRQQINEDEEEKVSHHADK